MLTVFGSADDYIVRDERCPQYREIRSEDDSR